MEKPMGERRTSGRQKSFLRGRIIYNNRQNVLDCLIRDISQHGANLVFSETARVPEAMELYVPQKDQTFRAHVQWRAGDEVGVTFGEAPSARAGGADLTGRVERLEAEVASLRRMLRRLKAGLAAGDAPESA
jgi:hypothetical protein